jgi:hypothetical protein
LKDRRVGGISTGVSVLIGHSFVRIRVGSTKKLSLLVGLLLLLPLRSAAVFAPLLDGIGLSPVPAPRRVLLRLLSFLSSIVRRCLAHGNLAFAMGG